MIKPPLPLDETARLKSLQSLRILDTHPEERFDRVTRMAQRIFGVDICLISLLDSDRQWFKSRQGLDACETGREISFCGHAILDDQVFIVENALEDERFFDNPLVTGSPDIRFYAGRPIKSPDGHRIGTLCLIHPEPHSLTDDEIANLNDLACMVEDELTLLSQTSVDDLTKLSNRRGFYTVARHMLPLCKRLDTIVEMLYFDLDGFKQVNDTLGHQAGDEVLVEFARLLIKCFRSADAIARLGGDEFAVLMAATDSKSILALERLERMAMELDAKIQERLSWSVGCVTFDPAKHTTIESLLAEADEEMYKDKMHRRQFAGAGA